MKQYLLFKKWIKQKQVENWANKLMMLWVGLVVLPLLIIVSTNDNALARVLGVSTQVIRPTPEPSIMPTTTPFPTHIPIFTPSPAVVKQKYIAPTVDSDPPVHCKISPTCGGGTTPLKQSECSNSTCCQIGDKWIFYKDKNQCTQDQNKLYGSTNFQQPQSASETSPSIQTVTCVLSYGTYQLTQSSCDSFKNSDKPYVPSGDYGNSGQTQQPTTPPDNSYNQQQNGQCKMYANQWYTNQGTQCSGSCAEAIKQIAYPQYQQKLKDCDSQYPI